MGFLGGKPVGGKSDHHLSVPAGQRKGPAEELFMSLMKGIEGSAYHNLHSS
jgi:hypothetical protein